jgi:hypothetical protein
MNSTTSNTTLSTAAASGTASLALIVILQWALSLRGINLPADVATALSTLLAAAVHYLIAIKVLPGLASDEPTPVTK